MSQDPKEPFFIGYLPKMPPSYAVIVRGFAIAAGITVAASFAVAAISQRPFDKGVYEYDEFRSFEGVIYKDPVPVLRSVDPVSGKITNSVLVGATKVAAPVDVLQLSGKKVRFKGSLVQRGAQTMIEYNSPQSLEVLGDPPANETRTGGESLGTMTLRGEIVDTKCFLGAMRPAGEKVHRGCAIRCLSGGVPPGFLVVDERGNETVFLLAGQPDKALDLDIQLAGLPVEITGQVEVQENLPLLRVGKITPIGSGDESTLKAPK